MSKQRPQVIIVGAGFGGLEAAKALRRAPVDITVIDRHNHHCFQPLLYQVATAALSPAEVAWPIRHILRRQKNATVLMAEVTGVDVARASVVLTASGAFAYDYLILATGATHSYFGHDEWAGSRPASSASRTRPDIRRTNPARLRAGRAGRGRRRAAAAADLRDRRRRARPASRWPARSPRSRATRCAKDFRRIDPAHRAHHPARGRAAHPAGAARRPFRLRQRRR